MITSDQIKSLKYAIGQQLLKRYECESGVVWLHRGNKQYWRVPFLDAELFESIFNLLSTMTPRKLLRLYRRYNKISSNPKLKQLQLALDTELLAEAKKRKPTIKKWDKDKVAKYLDSDFKQATFEKYAAIADSYSKRIKQIKEQISDELCSIPLVEFNIEQQKIDEWVHIESCSTSAYSSQGFGAKFYARNSLIPLQEKLEGQQIETRLTYEQSENGFGHMIDSGIYRLKAKIPVEYGWLICVHPDTQRSLVDIVQSMWYRGVNPRVHYPMLPHGFEEENNIKYTKG